MKKIKSLLVIGAFASSVLMTTTIVYAGSFSSTYEFGKRLKSRSFDVTSNRVRVELNSRSKKNVDGETMMYTTLCKATWYGGTKVGTKSNLSTQSKVHTWPNVSKAKYYLLMENQYTVWSKGNIRVYY